MSIPQLGMIGCLSLIWMWYQKQDPPQIPMPTNRNNINQEGIYTATSIIRV